ELAGLKGEEAQVFARERLLALTEEQKLQEREIALEMEAQARRLEELRRIKEGTAQEGLTEGFLQFAEQFSSTFLATLEIAKGAVQSFAGFLTDSISQGFENVGRTG